MGWAGDDNGILEKAGLGLFGQTTVLPIGLGEWVPTDTESIPILIGGKWCTARVRNESWKDLGLSQNVLSQKFISQY